MNSPSHLALSSRLALAWITCSLPSFTLAGDASKPQAPPPPPSGLEAFFTQDYLLGDWGGARTKLAENGLALEFFYFGSLPTNLHGGLETGYEYQQALLLAFDLDTKKVGAWSGGRLHGAATWIDGETFAERYVGDLNRSNIVDLANGWRLWELYYEQKLLNEKLTIKAGQMAVDSDFILPEYYGSLGSLTLINQTFFFPTLPFTLNDIGGFPVGSHSLPSTPFGALGALVKWQVHPKFYIQSAVYDGNADYENNGTGFDLSSQEGALWFFEAGYRSHGKDDHTGLPTSVKVGGYYHTDDFYDVKDSLLSLVSPVAYEPATHEGNYGLYALAEQWLTREQEKDDPAHQGLVAFLRAEVAPADRNICSFGIDGGLVYKGLIPGRDWDTLAIAASYLEMSDDLADAQRAINRVVPGTFTPVDYEAVIELSYKLQLAAWWTLQPSLQCAMHPGGSGAIDNAWVLGVVTTLRF